MRKLPSLSIFFPFYNDEGTVKRQIDYAYKIGRKLTSNLEVIALHGGLSKDDTLKKIYEMKKKYPTLKIIDKSDNREGYAVIKYGFHAATKKWIFYTDGDAQYHLEEDLEKLIFTQQKTKADIINGYKRKRGDNWIRTLLGNIYARISKLVFTLPIRDIDCDFRLIRRDAIRAIKLESRDASVLPEMVKKLELKGFRFAQIPVSHYSREYGSSNYTPWSLLREKIIGDARLYFKMKKWRDWMK